MVLAFRRFASVYAFGWTVTIESKLRYNTKRSCFSGYAGFTVYAARLTNVSAFTCRQKVGQTASVISNSENHPVDPNYMLMGYAKSYAIYLALLLSCLYTLTPLHSVLRNIVPDPKKISRM